MVTGQSFMVNVGLISLESPLTGSAVDNLDFQPRLFTGEGGEFQLFA